MNRKGEREMTINLNGRSHDRQGAKKEAKQINKTKQTASRHAFLRGITVNDALLFSLPRAPDSALIYDVECAPAIFIKRVCSRWITQTAQMPGHERYRRRGARVRGGRGVRGHGNVTSCRQTLICRPYYHIRGVSPLPFLVPFPPSPLHRAQ